MCSAGLSVRLLFVCLTKAELTVVAVLDALETSSSGPDFLFRAHTHFGESQPVCIPQLPVPSGMEFRRALSVDDFSSLLDEHLNMTQTEKEFGRRIRTCFVSTSPILEWTIHKAGQKWKEKSGDEVVGLAVFDIKKMRQNSGTIIFRVSDVLRFLASQGKDYLIQTDSRAWARNCDEYVSMGEIPNDALLSWVEWEELYMSPANLLSTSFLKAYTLGSYRDWTQQQYVDIDDICQRIVSFGKVLAGPRDDLLFPLIKLVLRPGIPFWGFTTEGAVTANIHALVDEMALQKFSHLSLK